MKTYRVYAYLAQVADLLNALSGVQARYCDLGYLVIDADYVTGVGEDGEEESEWLQLRLRPNTDDGLILSWNVEPQAAIFHWPALGAVTIVRLIEAFLTNPLVAQSCAARKAAGGVA